MCCVLMGHIQTHSVKKHLWLKSHLSIEAAESTVQSGMETDLGKERFNIQQHFIFILVQKA